jgi:hypothetical protein
MARNLLSNKFVFAAVVLAFVLALGVSAAYGETPTASPTRHLGLNAASDPTNPPDPWGPGSSLALASDPTNPPDPWGPGSSLALASDPTNPPDPWGPGSSLALASDPTNPPDPWGPGSSLAVSARHV